MANHLTNKTVALPVNGEKGSLPHGLCFFCDWRKG